MGPEVQEGQVVQGDLVRQVVLQGRSLVNLDFLSLPLDLEFQETLEVQDGLYQNHRLFLVCQVILVALDIPGHRGHQEYQEDLVHLVILEQQYPDY